MDRAVHMFEGWADFYIIVGPAAGALIGLMFVVVTLTAGRDNAQTERGKHLYTSPIVYHLSVVLGLSAAAVAPGIDPRLYGYAMMVLALIGLGMGCRSAWGIWSRKFTGEDTLFDTIWYGVAPSLAYIGLGIAGAATIAEFAWRADAIALSIVALLMVSIHAEWDLVTFLAPLAGTEEGKKPKGKV